MKLSELDHPQLNRKGYEGLLKPLQFELMTLQHGIFQQQKRCIIVVEGIDASGKGGMIRRTTELMDPRGYRVHPIGAPTAEELKEHYLQRFWRRLPKQGQTAIFDRSWYGRVLVERVSKLVLDPIWQRAYDEINQFEEQLEADGFILIKLFLSINKDEQLSRFRERIDNPKKRWKITPDDIVSRNHWDDYQLAFEDMLERTNRPWHVVGSNHKRHARIQCMQHIRDQLAQKIDKDQVQLLDPKVAELADKFLR
jgi:polyphosphate kinase 2 (PPK2 family)